MSTVISSPPFVAIDYPVLTDQLIDNGWGRARGTMIANRNTGWHVGATVMWHTLDLRTEVVWIARSARTGASASFPTWQEAVNFADVTGALE